MKKVKIIKEFLDIKEGECRNVPDDIARDLIARELAVEEEPEEVIDYKQKFEDQVQANLVIVEDSALQKENYSKLQQEYNALADHFNKTQSGLMIKLTTTESQLADALAKIAELEKPVTPEVKEEKAAAATKEDKTPLKTKAKK